MKALTGDIGVDGVNTDDVDDTELKLLKTGVWGLLDEESIDPVVRRKYHLSINVGRMCVMEGSKYTGLML